MCGICGFFSKRKITLDHLRQMNDRMFHRGPDDGGAEIFPAAGGYNLGLAQRRLAILDLTALGHQPMHSADGRVSVVFNGEIYNFPELKKQLKAYPFRSNCDTEVILAAYLRWGISCVEKLDGMFAIALYDRQEEILYLVRDRIGKKPLYYWRDGENLVFASELKPIMSCPGFERRIRRDILSRFLFQQYINAPDTVFEQVYKLEPGAVLSFCRGETSIHKYWDFRAVYRAGRQEPVTDYGQAKAELKELLRRAVAERMLADVPLGSFLSGGYDSSLVTAIAQEQSREPVKTFSIGFAQERYDESGYARQVAKYLGTKHTETVIDEKEMLAQVDSMARYYDEPFADSSQLPSMLVAALARREVTVALSGDGGDEFFCGYSIYRRVAQAQKLDRLGGLVYGALKAFPGLYAKLPFSVRVMADNRSPATKTQFCSKHYLHYAGGLVKGEGLDCRYPVEEAYGVKDWTTRRMLLDMDTYLPGDILCKVDRACMRYSLEGRCPLLDREVMAYSFRLEPSFKAEKGVQKRILKDIAYDYIPRELLERPKKGFSVPIGAWLQGPLRSRLLDYGEGTFLARQDLFEPDFVEELLKVFLEKGDAGPGSGDNLSRIVWAFFAFQQWYEAYMME